MRIFLIRHGESIGNKMNIHQGQTYDLPLSDQGIDQAGRVSDKLKNINFDAIYSSDLIRAKETARAINLHHNKEIRFDKRLRERNFGSLEDKNNIVKLWRDHVKKVVNEQGISPEEVKAPNGESDKDHWDRLSSFLIEMKKDHNNKTICVVAHAGTNKVMLGIIGHFSKDEMYKTFQGNTGINEFYSDKEKWEVVQHNSIDHLEPDTKALNIVEKVKKNGKMYSFDRRWKKNEELFNELKKEGLRVKYGVGSFRWDEQDLPKNILSLKHPEKGKHLFIILKSQGIYQKIDLSDFSFVKNKKKWNSFGDATLNVNFMKTTKDSHDDTILTEFKEKKNDDYGPFYDEISKYQLSIDPNKT